jgi:hypothetical protein
MPAKRTIINRPRRPHRFTPEALALFAELEAVPTRRRGQEWEAKSRRLAELLGPLGIGDEDFAFAWFCGRLDVLDREIARRPRTGYWEAIWLRVAATRELLLEAVAKPDGIAAPDALI